MILKKFKIQGMHCKSCEKIIAKKALSLEGVKSINVDYATETAGVEYEPDTISEEKIKTAIEEKGYLCSCGDGCENQTNNKNWLGWTFAGIGLLFLIYFSWLVYAKVSLPEIGQNMGYGLLFIVGLLTGFHCVGMCGGFVVSYIAKGTEQGKKPYQMHFSYALGKTLSYTFFGAMFGLLGSFIAFTPTMRGVAGVLAGLFLIIFGLKMLNIFPVLRKFEIRLPKFINHLIGRESDQHSNSPLVIGLLNGLMIACGPLQAIYILAAGTGSMLEGAKMLFIFGMGTLPVMLGFGYLTGLVSKKVTHKILKASGIIVIILGIIMLNRGLALTGSGYDFGSLTTNLIPTTTQTNPGSNSLQNDGIAVIKDNYQEINMDVLSSGWSPNKFVLQKGVPVKWIINGKELNGCNSGIQVPKLGLNFKIKPGIQTIEFTPTEEGTISWSCWMGMIKGVFIVKNKIDTNNANEVLNQVQVPKGSSCGGGGGGCGCGGGGF